MTREQNLYSYLLVNARPDAPAVITKQETTTYSSLIEQAESVACTLQTVGVQKSDRVGLIAENSPFWIACYLAILKLGAVATPLPLRLTDERVQMALTITGCHVVCMDTKRLGKYTLPKGCVVVTSQPSADAPDAVVPVPHTSAATCPVVGHDDLAALMFTSGSTGEPNAVKVSHRNIAANTDSIIEYLSLTSADRTMVVLPFEYCYGTSLLHTHLRVGGSLVLHNSFVFLEDLLNRMDSEACTGFAGVPTTYQHLLRRSSFPRRQFSQLRYAQQAGGRLPDAFIHEFVAAQPNVRLFVMYGQTEATARLSYLPPDRLGDKLGSIGRGIPGVSLYVLNSDGVPVQPGEIGEIVAEGDNVALGYWMPDPSKAPFRNGKLYTGDMARVDDEGFIFIADRVSDFIKPNGHRVSSREIEEVLAQIPDVVEVGVVGMPDLELGEAARAFVVKLKGSALSEKDILDYCKKRLPLFVVPREVVFMPELPKNEAQKVLKKLLKEYQTPV
jgi:long-chain acyl-CoA synthetase